MNIIVCLDENMGMLFNGRRQSKDKRVLEDIEKVTGEIWIHPFSKDLFAESNCNCHMSDSFLDQAGKNDYCFVEAHHTAAYLKQINQIVVYRWNRQYPSDFKCDIPFDQWQLLERQDFVGFSHDKITKEVYIRG